MVERKIEETKVAYPGLGERMRKARHQTGLSQEAVALRVGCSWMTIHRQETNSRAVKYKQLMKIADVYQVDMDRFLPSLRDPLPRVADSSSVTFFKGGPLEKSVDIDEVEIPDLWEGEDSIATKIQDPIVRERVFETWHIAHTLLKHLRAQPRAS